MRQQQKQTTTDSQITVGIRQCRTLSVTAADGVAGSAAVGKVAGAAAADKVAEAKAENKVAGASATDEVAGPRRRTRWPRQRRGGRGRGGIF